MANIIFPISSPLALPAPRVPICIRPGTMGDIPFIDSLQKLHTKQVGWMPTRQLEEKIGAGHVLVAWASGPCSPSVSDTGWKPVPLEPLGYCIGTDQYFKRDDCGIIYQLSVVPGKRRSLIGATLVKAMFDRAAYGCKLFCCWCAQDIEANYFWESLGFIPLAFRAGSRGKGRVHIFWQRRIRAGDTGQGGTPYWFPSQTASGSIREDRLVFPIPPGTHWSDAKPIILPGEGSGARGEGSGAGDLKRLPGPKSKKRKAVAPKPATASRGGLWFAVPGATEPAEKPKREPKSRRAGIKNDPAHVAAARELRDRWLEQANANPEEPVLVAQGKYEVSRSIERTIPVDTVRRLITCDALRDAA